jgi:purine-binding chemotaxis protein CheW
MATQSRKPSLATTAPLPVRQDPFSPLPPVGPEAALPGGAALSVHGSLVSSLAPATVEDRFHEFFLDPDRDGTVTPLGSPLEAPSRADLQRVLLFALGKEQYGLEIAAVRELLRPPVLTEVPRSPAHVMGVCSLRGWMLPVVNLAEILNAPCVDHRPAEARILVIGHGDDRVGLMVHSVAQVVKMSTAVLDPVPGVTAGERRGLIRGLARWDGHMVILLDVHAVMTWLGLSAQGPATKRML